MKVSSIASQTTAYLKSKSRKEVIKRSYGVKIKDSLMLLPHDLYILIMIFDESIQKSHFPYKFLTWENMGYVGEVPMRMYWNDEVPDEFYNKLLNEPWSLRDYLIKYLEIDLKRPCGALIRFADIIYQSYQLNITDFVTLPSLSMGIYRTKFYKEEVIPNIHGHVYNDIRKGCRGGVAGATKPRVWDGYYYDANSLYPHCMTQPMPVGSPVYTTEKNLDKKFGYAHCRITTPKNLHVPVLPYKTEEGSVINPVGTWEGTYFTPELIQARDCFGYKIEVLRAYKFEKGYEIFSRYVKTFYDFKSSNDDPAMRLIAKLMLNSLYGKFGAQEYYQETTIMSKDQVDALSKAYNVVNVDPINGTDKEIITYDIHPDDDLCYKNDIDYIKELLGKDDNGRRNNNRLHSCNHNSLR